MTKKRPLSASSSSSSVQSHFWSGLKIVTSLSVFMCLFLLLSPQSSSPNAVRDKALEFGRRPVEPFFGTPKIAFLFLARSNLPLDFVWHFFFQNADEGTFSIYIHSEPRFVLDESTTKSSFFYGRQLTKRVHVAWGESSMIKAERLLFEAALQDPANRRFILLSDSCIPLHNFSYVYNYLMSSSKSFVDSFLDTKEGRYNPKMSPIIPKGKWRKGSQWITLIRKHAEIVLADDVVFPIFRKHCKRRPALDLGGNLIAQRVAQKEHNCIPDEHYIQTLLAMSELEDELERRTITYTSWNESATEMEGNRWHPMKFGYNDASPEHIKQIKDINHVYYETEYRTEWCHSNGTSVPCFLFARKFSPGAAMRLLRDGVVGPVDATALLT
ncbi:glycosyltransferase BC10-like [Aristolochia californica]|uniref:glycosyltransferase BC10-like n=1 Tax=Aristolochia californica TaxID=171875 RepID=UPI0035DD83FD